jgi:hypothetical protein
VVAVQPNFVSVFTDSATGPLVQRTLIWVIATVALRFVLGFLADELEPCGDVRRQRRVTNARYPPSVSACIQDVGTGTVPSGSGESSTLRTNACEAALNGRSECHQIPTSR